MYRHRVFTMESKGPTTTTGFFLLLSWLLYPTVGDWGRTIFSARHEHRANLCARLFANDLLLILARCDLGLAVL